MRRPESVFFTAVSPTPVRCRTPGGHEVRTYYISGNIPALEDFSKFSYNFSGFGMSAVSHDDFLVLSMNLLIILIQPTLSLKLIGLQ